MHVLYNKVAMYGFLIPHVLWTCIETLIIINKISLGFVSKKRKIVDATRDMSRSSSPKPGSMHYFDGSMTSNRGGHPTFSIGQPTWFRNDTKHGFYFPEKYIKKGVLFHQANESIPVSTSYDVCDLQLNPKHTLLQKMFKKRQALIINDIFYY